jgi:hypothetical protein
MRQMVAHRINPYSACREDLHRLAIWAMSDSLGEQIEAFFGRTLLAVGGARLGFTVRDTPYNLWGRFERFFMVGLLLLYSDGGLQRLTHGTTVSSYPKEVWMSRADLIRLYGGRDGHRLDAGSESHSSARLPS